jgi:hypothetical protein
MGAVKRQLEFFFAVLLEECRMPRIICCFLVMVLFGGVLEGQGINPAEQAFLASAKKLSEADSVQINVDGASKNDRVLTINGTVLMGAGNKSRLFLTGEAGKRTFKLISICDGVQLSVEWANDDEKGTVCVVPAPKNANSMLAGVISRAGLMPGLYLFIRLEGLQQLPPDLDEMVALSDFSMGKKEKVGDRQCQRIDYKVAITTGTKKEKLFAQVWIDCETHLPLKRILNDKKSDEKPLVLETYEFRLGGKIEAKKFELPK